MQDQELPAQRKALLLFLIGWFDTPARPAHPTRDLGYPRSKLAWAPQWTGVGTLTGEGEKQAVSPKIMKSLSVMQEGEAANPRGMLHNRGPSGPL